MVDVYLGYNFMRLKSIYDSKEWEHLLASYVENVHKLPTIFYQQYLR